MTRPGKSGVAKPWGEAAADDPSLALARAQARPAPGPAGRADLTVTASGDEQLINSFTTGTQVGPIIARGGSGNVAVAWVSISQDGDGGGVYMRVYAPNGNAVIGETRVNQATAGTQNAPSITTLDNGNFVVAWQQRVVLNPPPQTTFLDQVYYRVYSPNGTAITGELTANSAIHKSEGLPSIGGLDGGGFAISWSVEFDDGRREIFVRTFNDAGVPNANEQFANTQQAGTQTGSRIVGLEGGGFVVVWESQSGPVTTARAQRFAGNGSLIGGEFAPQAQAGVSERLNDVIALDGGGFVVLLSREISSGINGLYARIYDANGVAVGGEKTLATDATGNGHELTPLAGGGFAAAWETPSSLGADAHGRLFDAAGNPISDEFTANQTTTGSQGFVDLVERAGGGLVYAWSGNGTGDSAGVFTRAFDAASVPGAPIVGDGGDNHLLGTPADDVLQGLGGNDTLNGGAGADRMEGGAGNDFSFVDNGADQVVELAGAGTDRLFASVSYALAGGASVETLSTTDNVGTAAINLTGNELANTIFGNNGSNILDGKAGADTLAGFGGDDLYFVDSALDRVAESAGQGTDRVFAGVSYALGAGVSVETLGTTNNAGTGALNLTGNELAQTVIGNEGANSLDGKGGADTMAGLGGNDFYYADNAADRVIEAAGAGSDRVFASLSYTLGAGVSAEILGTTNNAGTGAIDLTGNELANTLLGNAGANILDGKGGADTLAGSAGADGFAFTTALGGGNVDRIGDFQSGVDKLRLDDAIFGGIGTPGAFNAAAFVTGNAAADGNDRIVYNGATGQLFYDADGSGTGAAVLFATLDGHPVLTASDFTVI